LKASVKIVMTLFFSLFLLSIISQVIANGAAIGGKVYVRNYRGDYRETGEANITAAGEHGVFQGQFNQGGNYYMFVPPGNYLVTAKKPGYIGQAREVTVSEGGSVSINFYLEQLPPEPEDPEPDNYESEPVGGSLMPVNKLEILTPYLVLAGIVAVASAIYIKKRRH
jgi:hypothetical protein